MDKVALIKSPIVFYRTGSRWKIRSTDLFTWSASGGPSEKSLQTRWTSDDMMLVVKRTKRNNKGAAVVSFFVDSCHQLQLQKQGTPYARCEVKVWDSWQMYLFDFNPFWWHVSQLGTAECLRSSKKMLPSESLSTFVVSWKTSHFLPSPYFIQFPKMLVKLLPNIQTKPRMGENPVFEEGNNFVCRNTQTNALSIQVIYRVAL